ncbi:MAG: CTP synthase, partial [Clostridia bacterium]
DAGERRLDEWKAMLARLKAATTHVKIALVGKYVALRDAYLSVAEALHHGGIENDAKIDIEWIDSENITCENAAEYLSDCDGILVPGGFGDRGVDGKIYAIQYARENNVPFLGICLGMQMAVVEYARNVLGFVDAHSSEFECKSDHAVIDIMPEQRDISDKGGTMRLGAYPSLMKKGSKVPSAYGKHTISE